MAEARFFQGELSCTVSLDLLKDPVTIQCGHSYCKSCIAERWDHEDQMRVYSCPQCRQTFSPRPALARNTMLTELVEKLKKTKLPADCYAGAGDVQCDVCSGRKYKAVKSCLVCQESYCQTHFDRHEEFHSRKPHKVIDATGRLQEMVCQKHEKHLEMFCITDQQCICELLVFCNIYYHPFVLQKQLKEMQKISQQREKDLQQLREARSAQTAVEDSERIFTELICSTERRCSELVRLLIPDIRDQEKAAVSQAEGRLERLEQEINDLRRRDAELEQLSHTQDHIQYLQDLETEAEPVEQVSRVDPAEQEVRAEPAEQEARVEPAEQEARVEPAEQEARVEPAEQEARVEPAEQEARVEPAEQEARVEPAEQEARVEPAEQEARVEPAEQEARVEPAEQEARVEPAEQEARVEPAEQEARVEPAEQEARAEPAEQGEPKTTRTEQAKLKTKRAELVELKSTRAEMRTTTAEQMGPKIPMVELMVLRTTSVELMVQETTTADQAGLQ
uniref:RING-type domain-containing protein n=1 Tax=Sinocyclocheilus anshuiensis TaxID=1608454 RepID=A0A671P482_9TELE